jgi:uncharacterized membrane-anchored protein
MNDMRHRVLSKVPEVTLGFWIIKIFATTLGEVGGNAVTMRLGLGYLVGTAIFAAALLLLLSAQIKADRFHPFLYWGVITATTLAGRHCQVEASQRRLGAAGPGLMPRWSRCAIALQLLIGRCEASTGRRDGAGG